MRHWHYRAFLLDFEGSQPQRKAKRAGSYQSGKNSQCLTSASKVQYGKALELIAGYRSFPPVGPIRPYHRWACRDATALDTLLSIALITERGRAYEATSLAMHLSAHPCSYGK